MTAPTRALAERLELNADFLLRSAVVDALGDTSDAVADLRAAAALLREPPTDEAVARELANGVITEAYFTSNSSKAQTMLVRAVRAAEARAKEAK